MKTIFFKSALVFGILLSIGTELHAQRQCGTMDLLKDKFKRNPALKTAFEKRQSDLFNFIQQRQKNKSFEKTLATPAVVPIVFQKLF